MREILGRDPITPRDAVRQLLVEDRGHTWHQNYALNRVHVHTNGHEATEKSEHIDWTLYRQIQYLFEKVAFAWAFPLRLYL